jgi:palmitoyltransferase
MGVSRYTLSDVWHALKTQQNFDYVFWIDITLQIMAYQGIKLGGFVLVLFAIIGITLFSYLGIFHVVPEISTPGSAWAYFNYIFGSFLIVNVYFNYLNGVFRSPGYAEKADALVVASPYQGAGDDARRTRQCKKCDAVKLPRTHHCSVCSKCVMR